MSPDGGVTWTNITAKFYDCERQGQGRDQGRPHSVRPLGQEGGPLGFDEKTCYVGFSGYRTNNEDKTWLYVTHDPGKTWKDISGGMNNPIFDVEEDPDNANVLYLATDYGIFVTSTRGRHGRRFDLGARRHHPHLAIQKRDREMAIGTYGRGIYITDIGPFKEITAEMFQDAHLFDIKDTIRWNRYERRGESSASWPRPITRPSARRSTTT